MNHRKCHVCKAALAQARLDDVEGVEGRLTVRLQGVPVLECPNGHRRFVHPDFPLMLLDRLIEHDTARLPVSDARGFLVKQHHCRGCGERLDAPDTATRAFKLGMDLPDVEPFAVELTLPVHRCQNCAVEQVHSLKEVRRCTPAALAHAFKAAQIAAGR